MKLFAVEGNTQRLDGGAMFGNAPKELWKRWVTPDAQNRIPLACRALLVETDDGRNVLFETGVGAFFEPKLKERYGIQESEHMLLHNLAKLGVSPSDIDAVILSHLHFDHAGGLLSAYDQGASHLVFPKATFYVGKSHWERARHPHSRERASFIPHLQELIEKSGRLILIDQPEHPDMNFGVIFHFCDGHTVGLMVSQLELSTGPLLFISDMAPGVPWVHLPITMGYDRFAEQVVEEKKRLFDSVIDRKPCLFFTHDFAVACAYLKRDVSGKYFAERVKVEHL